MESRLRTSPQQFFTMLEFMERNGDISRPRPGLQGKIKAKHLWHELTDIMNSVNFGVKRSCEKWKKIWADWKAKTKKKWILSRRFVSGVDGEQNRWTLFPHEVRLLKVLGITTTKYKVAIKDQNFDTVIIVPEELSSPAQECPPIADQEGEIVPNLSQCVAEGAREDRRMSPGLSAPATPPPNPPTASHSAGHSVDPRKRKRWRTLPAFDGVTNAFIALEEQRLRLEDARDKRLHDREMERERLLHEREMERIRVESQRIEVDRMQTQLLQRFTDITHALSESLSSNR